MAYYGAGTLLDTQQEPDIASIEEEQTVTKVFEEEETDEPDEISDKLEVVELPGNSRILVDTFGYYIPPARPPPPVFPRPTKMEDVERAKAEMEAAQAAGIDVLPEYEVGNVLPVASAGGEPAVPSLPGTVIKVPDVPMAKGGVPPPQPAPLPPGRQPVTGYQIPPPYPLPPGYRATPGYPTKPEFPQLPGYRRDGEIPAVIDDKEIPGEYDVMPEDENKLDDMYVDHPEEPKKIIVKRYTMINSKGISIQVIDYGATVVSMSIPDKYGAFADVILGFDNMKGYQSKSNQYIGGTLGRFSSVITDGKFSVGSKEFYLSQNSGQHHVLGGCYGFDKAKWDSCIYKNKVVMTYVSKDGEEGYPGDLMVQTEFSLSRNNTFIIHTTATCSKPTVVGISNNIMFNLEGHGAGPSGLKRHSIIVNADRFVVSDIITGIPTGEIQNVGATYYDLRVPRPLSKAILKAPGGGYDQTFCLTKGLKRQSLYFAARLVHPDSGRFLEIQTDQPGLLVYTCNRLPNPDPGFLRLSVEELEGEEYKCRMEFGEDHDQWPMRVLSRQFWDRPLSAPEEEHIFPVSAEDEDTTNLETEDFMPMDDTEDASMMELEGDTVYEAAPFDPEEFYRDEAESLHEEMEGEDMYGEQLIAGKFGCTYRDRCAIVLMPQEYPDAPKYRHFPRTLVQPSKPYSRTTTYRFGIIPLPKEEEIIGAE